MGAYDGTSLSSVIVQCLFGPGNGFKWRVFGERYFNGNFQISFKMPWILFIYKAARNSLSYGNGSTDHTLMEETD